MERKKMTEKTVEVNYNNLMNLLHHFNELDLCYDCPLEQGCECDSSVCEKNLAKYLGFSIKSEKEEWVEKISAKIQFDNRCSFYTQNRTVVCVCKYNSGDFAVGIAHCHEDDEFDIHVGKAIAYSRAKKWFLPKGL